MSTEIGQAALVARAASELAREGLRVLGGRESRTLHAAVHSGKRELLLVRAQALNTAVLDFANGRSPKTTLVRTALSMHCATVYILDPLLCDEPLTLVAAGLEGMLRLEELAQDLTELVADGGYRTERERSCPVFWPVELRHVHTVIRRLCRVEADETASELAEIGFGQLRSRIRSAVKAEREGRPRRDFYGQLAACKLEDGKFRSDLLISILADLAEQMKVAREDLERICKEVLKQGERAEIGLAR